MNELYINQSTDPYGDLNLANGVLQLIRAIAPGGRNPQPTIEDTGGIFRITMERAIVRNWFDLHIHPIALNDFIQTSSKTALKPPSDFPTGAIVDYDAHKNRNNTWWDAVRKLEGKDRVPERATAILMDRGFQPPAPQWAIWALINQQKAIKSYDKIVLLWHAHRGAAFPRLLYIIFDLFQSPINDTEAAVDAWKALAKEHGIDANPTETATQIVNPGMGKGSTSVKATGVTEKNLNRFWLLEYLRFAGLSVAGIPLTVQGGKDRKIYMPFPKKMRWDTATEYIFSDYRQVMIAQTAVKLDILATFRYMNTYLKHWMRAQDESEDEFDIVDPYPDNHARAIGVVSLKDMGSAHAIMGINELPIPRWVKSLERMADGDRYQEIIQDHQRVVESLNETHSDENLLLRQYRRFLTTNDIYDLLEFLRGYAGLTLTRINEGRYAPHLYSPYLEEVLMNTARQDLVPILHNPGFQAVAEAIRRSTVTPQYQKPNNSYEIRYGLGDKLYRAAINRNRFIEELTQFMYLYNRETTRLYETRKMQFRKLITTQDVEELVGLIDAYGDCKLIAGLLVAYGHARVPKDEAEETDNSESITES